MSEDNGFILKAEMYNQEEWYQMYLSMLKVCKELQQENQKYKEVIDKAIEYIENQIPIVKNEINIPNVNTATSELLNYGQLLEILKRW